MRNKYYFVCFLIAALLIIICYMAFNNPVKQIRNISALPTIEGFSFVDKPKPTKLGERKRENFLE